MLSGAAIDSFIHALHARCMSSSASKFCKSGRLGLRKSPLEVLLRGGDTKAAAMGQTLTRKSMLIFCMTCFALEILYIGGKSKPFPPDGG
jgi:hypothetical protein